MRILLGDDCRVNRRSTPRANDRGQRRTSPHATTGRRASRARRLTSGAATRRGRRRRGWLHTSEDERRGDAGARPRRACRPPGHGWPGRTATSRPAVLRPRGRRPLLGRRREAQAVQTPEATREHPRPPGGRRPRRPLRGGLDAALVGEDGRDGESARQRLRAGACARAPAVEVRAVPRAAADRPRRRRSRRTLADLGAATRANGEPFGRGCSRAEFRDPASARRCEPARRRAAAAQ
jgi:hypothetical protein